MSDAASTAGRAGQGENAPAENEAQTRVVDAPASTTPPRSPSGCAAYVSPYRTEEERFDAAVVDAELRGAGVIEDDEPTEYSHDAWMRRYYERAQGEFTPGEREQIRAHLGLGPFGDDRG